MFLATKREREQECKTEFISVMQQWPLFVRTNSTAYIHILTHFFGFCRLIAVGEEFCGSTSEDLHDSIRTQTVKYFKTYHRSRMDELRMFLENDAWELCPVKASFKIVDLSVSKS